ncbi:MAG TPA: methyltransferase domain-containing protein [Bryobacteraceae bacterium]|nr:methyltransferase domain-containing protein [Bryobacteraceae bacterium]
MHRVLRDLSIQVQVYTVPTPAAQELLRYALNLPPPSIPADKRLWDIGEIVTAVHEFEQRLNAAKERAVLPEGRSWYPYYTFASIEMLEVLLTGERRKLLALTEGYPVLDIGCADGDLSYFFEECGLEVHAIDHPSTNYNSMEGVRAVKAALHSAVKIGEVDLDSQFALPRQTYGLVLLFGVLYHLKNPIYVLEALSRRAKYCLLSTRIARMTPDHATELRDIPVGYLLGQGETNDDVTNYWIFSDAGLKRLFERTGWRVCDFITVGAREASDPVHDENDERAFCLLQSCNTDLDLDARLGEGWYDWDGTYRWTAHRFSFHVRRPRLKRSTPELYLRFLMPVEILDARPSVTLAAWVNGCALPAHRYTTAGEHVYQEKIPGGAMAEELEIVFETDDVVRPPAPDIRELGVFVPFDAWFPLTIA